MEEIRNVRLATMVKPSLVKRAQKIADAKRWTMSTFIEEAIMEKVDCEEQLRIVKK